MRSILAYFPYYALFGASIAARTSTKICPLLGSAFPSPTGLSSSDRFHAVTKSFDDTLTAAFETGISINGPAPFNTTSISIGMFSISEDDLIYQRHYTDPFVRNSTHGTHEVNAESIYRIGSISKLLTVYLFLIREGDQRLNDPITKYIPQLAEAASHTTNTTNGATPKWNEITLLQLASHMSGIARDYGVDDVAYPAQKPQGYPSLSADQIPACNYIELNGSFIPCDTKQLFDGINAEPALFLSGTTPVYSNNAFPLLGLALEKITGSDLETLYNESIVKALGLQHTSFTVPKSTRDGVIPGTPTSSGWDSELEALSAAGGYFSSTNDMASIGKAILNSTLLSPAQTRRWMKPVTFTAALKMAVGAPWEIYRTEIGGRTVDMYTKNGGWGAYGTQFVLVPDYNFGFSVLTASNFGEASTALVVYGISDMVASAVLPALEDIARTQANATFAGHYVASSQEDLNSSLTITVDDGPGLRVTQWTSNGTDFFEDNHLNSAGTYLDFRLYPNQLYTGSNVGFTGAWQTIPAKHYEGAFDLNCVLWANTDSITYGNVGIEDFVFEVDPTTERVTNLQLKALRTTLERA